MKKFLSYLCIVAMILTIVQIPAFAEEGEVTAISVSAAIAQGSGDATIRGIVVGVAFDKIQQGFDLLLKDENSNAVIGVRNSKVTNSSNGTPSKTASDGYLFGKAWNAKAEDGTDGYFGYKKGQVVELAGTLGKAKASQNSVSYNANKLVLKVTYGASADQSATIKGTAEVKWDMEAMADKAITISEWADIQANFTETSAVHYQIYKFTGGMYELQGVAQTATALSGVHFLHNNSGATNEDNIYTQKYGSGNAKRKVAILDDIMKANLGTEWMTSLFGVSSTSPNYTTTTYPGYNFNNEFYAMYTGGGTNYFPLVILDESWIKSTGEGEAAYPTAMEVTTPPTKLAYLAGESLDTTGMVVTATMSDGTTKTLTAEEYTVSPATLSEVGEAVTVTVGYGTLTDTFTVSVRASSVEEALTFAPDTKATVTGIFAGVARDGRNSVYEFLLKDKTSNQVISVRSSGVKSTSTTEADAAIFGKKFSENFGYTIGDEIVLEGKLINENIANTYNTNKLLLQVTYGATADQAATIIKKAEAGTEVNWDLDAMKEEATVIRTWDEMKAAFTADNTEHYKIFKFVGDMFMSASTADHTILHKNAEAAATADRTTSTYNGNARSVDMRPDVFNLNLGADWKNLFVTAQDEIETVKGQAFSKDFYAIYVGGGTYYYNIVVLDDSWISEAATITGIAASEPTNATYIVGESFDKNTVTVTATYSDGSTQVVTDYEVSPATFTEKGEKEVTISYAGCETKVNVTVAGLQGISATAPTKSYKIGDTFDKEDITVTATYENGSTAPVTEYTVTPDVFTVAGTQAVTIGYGEFTTTVDVTVHGIKRISVTPAKTEYFWGEALKAADVAVKAVYGNGEEIAVTDYTTDAPKAFEASQTVTVTYKDMTASYDVTVYQVAGITVEKTDSFENASYAIGDAFAKSTVVVTASYAGTDATKAVTDYTVEPKTFSESGDAIPVTISYCGFEDTSITVKVEGVESLTIALKSAYSDKTYTIGEELKTPYNFYTVTATFENGEVKTINTGATFAVGELKPGTTQNLTFNDYGMQPVSVRYKGATATCYVPVNDIEHITVAEALSGKRASDDTAIDSKTLVKIEGYYAGVARDGSNKVYDLLLKEKDTNQVICVRNSKYVDNGLSQVAETYPIYGVFPNFGYEVGQKIVLTGYAKKDDARTYYNESKRIFSFVANCNPVTQDRTIIEGDKIEITWNMDEIEANAIELDSWDDAKNAFGEEVDDVPAYTFFKITGQMYQYGAASSGTYMIHMNPDAKEEFLVDEETGELVLDEETGEPIRAYEPETYVSEYKGYYRRLGIRDDVTTANIGADWLEKLIGTGALLESAYPGEAFKNEFYAMYIGGNPYYLQLLILDEDWIINDVSEKITVNNGVITVKNAAAGEYKVVIAQYENNKVTNLEIAPVSITESDVEKVVERTQSFELTAGTKIMLFKGDYGRLAPLSKAYVVE